MTDENGRARVLVTGGTGKTGGRLARRLVELGLDVQVASRRPPAEADMAHVAFDWDEPATFAAALAGATRVYLVAPPLSTEPERAMLPFIHLALERGVRRFALLSS
jgi:uncharacterized protein YbjT (DUF2867 family)